MSVVESFKERDLEHIVWSIGINHYLLDLCVKGYSCTNPEHYRSRLVELNNEYRQITGKRYEGDKKHE
jgi:hypothetical protein